MPELPDVTVYVEALAERVVGEVLEKIRLKSPFVLRSVRPRPRVLEGKTCTGMRRIGKRIVFEFEDDLYLVIHLMVAGRFKWGKKGAAVPGRIGLGAFDFASGTLLFTEASSKKRASIHVVEGAENLAEHDRGGLEVMGVSLAAFKERLTRKNHTLKRAMTDPRIFSGIGNAYSDEILFHAHLSPMKLTQKISDEEIERLHAATQSTLEQWTQTLRDEAKAGFPTKVTAFRDEMAVHGKYKQPCPVCGNKVQRIVYAENETNYCATCQNGGKLLKDRSLSRLLKDDWPKTVEEME